MPEQASRAEGTRLAYEQLERRFVDWAETQPDIRAAVVVGSRARSAHPADEWADLDIVLYVTNPQEYLDGSDWLSEIGPVLVSFVAMTAGAEPEQLVLFDGGLNADFVIVSIDTLRRAAEAGRVPAGFYRGVRVLVDKDGVAARTLPPAFRPPTPARSSPEEAVAGITRFWYGAYYIAKQLRRGELWVALSRHREMIDGMLSILEMHAHATKGWDLDTWHSGRFIDKWADRSALAELPNIFPQYNGPDAWRALLAVLDLFRRLATEIAQSLGVPYPQAVDDSVSNLIMRLYQETLPGTDLH